MFLQLLVWFTVISILYTLRRIWRLSMNQCIVTHISHSGTRVLRGGIWVLYPIVESVCTVNWTVSKYDDIAGKYFYSKKETDIIDLKERNFTVAALTCKTKDDATVLLDMTFTYHVHVDTIEHIVNRSDPILDAEKVSRLVVTTSLYKKTLHDTLQTLPDVSASVFHQLKEGVQKRDIGLNITAVYITSIRHTAMPGDKYQSGAADPLVLNCCKQVKLLKKKYQGLSDSALAYILLHYEESIHKQESTAVIFESDSDCDVVETDDSQTDDDDE